VKAVIYPARLGIAVRFSLICACAGCAAQTDTGATSSTEVPAGPTGGTGGSAPTRPRTDSGATATGGRAGASFGAANVAGTPMNPSAAGQAPLAMAGNNGLPGGASSGAAAPSSGTGGANSAAGGSTPGGGTSGTVAGAMSGGGGAAPAAGSAGAGHKRDHCIDGYEPHPADNMMKDGYAVYVKNGQADVTVQPEVIQWMTQNVWQEAHFQWHNIRRCNPPPGGLGKSEIRGGLDICKYTELVPADQENEGPGDGLQFLAMHRHMIQSLRQLFPKHAEQFQGWERFPQSKADLPVEWQAEWTPFTGAEAQNLAKADNPAANLSMWPTDGDFGQWIQSTSGIHVALHFKWVRPQNSDHGLGNQYTNIDNYMFWKMHGWIDKVWDRYRAAKGKKPTDRDIQDAVLKQCREMDTYAVLIKPDLKPNPGVCTTPAPQQTGVFATTIRKIFENDRNKCTGCHGPSGGMANLSLGGSECIKSSDIVANLVNRPSINGGQFKLVVPNKPEESWLYLKVTNRAATAGCTPTATAQCNTGSMPQGSPTITFTAEEQEALRKWIADGAMAPQ
jgi:hypothetical protein